MKTECEREFPDFERDIPSIDSINIGKCNKFALAIDTCNQDQKARSLVRGEMAQNSVEEGVTVFHVVN